MYVQNPRHFHEMARWRAVYGSGELVGRLCGSAGRAGGVCLVVWPDPWSCPAGRTRARRTGAADCAGAHGAGQLCPVADFGNDDRPHVRPRRPCDTVGQAVALFHDVGRAGRGLHHPGDVDQLHEFAREPPPRADRCRVLADRVPFDGADLFPDGALKRGFNCGRYRRIGSTGSGSRGTLSWRSSKWSVGFLASPLAPIRAIGAPARTVSPCLTMTLPR